MIEGAAPPKGDDRRRGFALLIVLWTLVLISLIVTHLASTGRTEARIASNLTRAAGAEAAADGAVFETIFRLLDASDRHWNADGQMRRLKLDGGEASVQVRSESGLINPNTAPPELLQALLQAVGVDSNTALRIAAAMADWREPGDTPRAGGAKIEEYRAAGLDRGPPGEPFQSVDEIGRVLGVTPDVLAALRPHLSIYNLGMPDPNLADPVVRVALQRMPGGEDADGMRPAGADCVTITASVHMKSGAEFTRRATVRLGAMFERGYSIVKWDAVQA